MDVSEPGLLERHPWVARRKIDADEFLRMADVGILGQDERVELIDGGIVAMAPIGSDHAGTVLFLNRVLARAVGDRALVLVQSPILLNRYSQPEPDCALLRPRKDFYRRSHPNAADVMLLVEVAASSLAYDRRVKLPLYARHGIPEVWIVDLAGEMVEVHRAPSGDAFTDVLRAGRGDNVSPVALTYVSIAVADLLGRSS